jgi:hypothetical protein
MHDWNNTPTFNVFHMDETEVTNFMYRVFRLVENVFP